MKPKRILYLENGIGYGGAAISLIPQLTNLNRKRFYPIVVTSHKSEGYSKFKAISEWKYISDKVIHKEQITKILRINKLASLLDYLINFLPYILRLLVFCKIKKIDLIYLNNDPISNMAGIIVARVLRIPCVCYLKGILSWDSKISRWLVDRVDRFIAVSDYIKKELLSFSVDKKRIQVIRDSIDLNWFNPSNVDIGLKKEFNLRTNQLSVGMVGRLNPWKGHKIFIEAAERVLKEFPDCKFFIVGGAPKKYKKYEAELKALVREKNVEKNVVFTGQREDVARVVGILDVIVHASIEPEPSGRVIVEAMAMERPVIATNIGGPPEVVENYKTGILTPPKDPNILAEKICELLRNPDMRSTLGKNARKLALEKYSIENDTRQMEKIYEELVYSST